MYRCRHHVRFSDHSLIHFSKFQTSLAFITEYSVINSLISAAHQSSFPIQSFLFYHRFLGLPRHPRQCSWRSLIKMLADGRIERPIEIALRNRCTQPLVPDSSTEEHETASKPITNPSAARQQYLVCTLFQRRADVQWVMIYQEATVRKVYLRERLAIFPPCFLGAKNRTLRKQAYGGAISQIIWLREMVGKDWKGWLALPSTEIWGTTVRVLTVVAARGKVGFLRYIKSFWKSLNAWEQQVLNYHLRWWDTLIYHWSKGPVVIPDWHRRWW